MEVEIKLEPGRRDPKLVILTGEMTGEITELARRLSGGESRFLAGFRDGQVLLLEPSEIRRIYAQDQLVLARTADDTLTLRSRLYELEEKLAGGAFLRISHAEIVNFDHVRSLDLSMAGTISLRLDNGDITFVSRRNMGRIKSYLNI